MTLYCIGMDFFHRKKKCDQCDEKFATDDELMHHARHIHHQTIVNCTECGKEFVHEKDRLHHARKEHDEKMKKRSNNESFPDKKDSLQDRVDEQTKHFSDKL